MDADSKPRLVLGRMFVTPGAMAALRQAGDAPFDFLLRHSQCDWGEVCEEDRRRNDQALTDGSRILAAYRTSLGEKLWVISEAVNYAGRRTATTILLPSEY